MKPKDLKPAYSWDERRPLLDDGVLYVPDYYENYDEFSFPEWEAIFNRPDPVVCIEYCSGNGAWIAERAKQHPELCWVAVEKRFDRVRKIWSKRKNEELNNLFVVCGEALTSTRHYFPDATVAEVYVNFPDPWPKDRHAKHRLVTPDFIRQLRRVMLPGAELTLVTDDVHTSDRMVDALMCDGVMQSEHPEPHYITHLEGYGSSFFDALWRARGKEIRYHQFRNPVGEVAHAS